MCIDHVLPLAFNNMYAYLGYICAPTCQAVCMHNRPAQLHITILVSTITNLKTGATPKYFSVKCC